MTGTKKLRIRDETAGGEILREVALIFDRQKVPLRDVIEARIRQEVEAYNRDRPNLFQGLVIPTDAEMTLNGARLRQKRNIDADKQVQIALKAFDKNGYFVLVGDRQIEDLDHMVDVGPDVEVSFIKLTPLVGG